MGVRGKIRLLLVFLLLFTAGNSDEVITHLKIALAVIASFLVLLGPCGCYCLSCFYRNRVHKWCKAKVPNIPPVHIVPAFCCRDRGYEEIGVRVDYNRQGEQINQNQDQNQAAQ